MATIAGIQEHVRLYLLGGTEEQRHQAIIAHDLLNYPVPPTTGDMVQLGDECWLITDRVISDCSLCLTMRHIDRDTQPDRIVKEATT